MTVSSSIRERALQMIMARLSAPGTPAVNVFRSNLDQITADDLPCFDFTPGDEKIDDPGEYGDKGSVTNLQPVAVRAIIDAAVDQSAEEIDDSGLDPFQVWAVRQLAGSDCLGGLVIEVEMTGGPTIFQPAGKAMIGRELNFILKYATKRGDPTQKG